MPKRIIHKILVGAFLLFLSVFLAAADKEKKPPPGRISGEVMDDQEGCLISGVTIQLTSLSSGNPSCSVTSDEKGRYLFEEVTPGCYDLRADLEGFRASFLSGIEVLSGQTTIVPIRLHIPTFSDMVNGWLAGLKEVRARSTPVWRSTWQDPNSYFPPGVFDDFKVQWYSNQLAALAEAPLPLDPHAEVYRFT